jgi:hypothetical protein
MVGVPIFTNGTPLSIRVSDSQTGMKLPVLIILPWLSPSLKLLRTSLQEKFLDSGTDALRSHDQIQSLLSENTGFTPFTYILYSNRLKEVAETKLIEQYGNATL